MSHGWKLVERAVAGREGVGRGKMRFSITVAPSREAAGAFEEFCDERSEERRAKRAQERSDELVYNVIKVNS